jgi:mRNA interferase MazF
MQGEIWLINLDPTIGAEMRKTRPALIISNDVFVSLPLKIILPITDWKEHYSISPWMIQLLPSQTNGLTKLSSIDCFQIRSVSENRLIRKIGNVSEEIMPKINPAISQVIEIPNLIK